MQRDFEELPEGSIGSLRDSLIELLLRFAADNQIVRVQLCLALAAMCAHVPSLQWGQGGIIQWLMSRLEGVPPATAFPAMLDMLTVLPEVSTVYMLGNHMSLSELLISMLNAKLKCNVASPVQFLTLLKPLQQLACY